MGRGAVYVYLFQPGWIARLDKWERDQIARDRGYRCYSLTSNTLENDLLSIFQRKEATSLGPELSLPFGSL